MKVNATLYFSYISKELSSLKSIFVENPSLFKSLSIGLLIRLVLAPLLGHPYDLRIFMAVAWAVANGITPYGQYVLQRIFVDMPHPYLYGTCSGIGYPPSWGLILGSIYFFSSIVAPGNIYAFVLALKVPIIVGDVVASILLYRILESEVGSGIASKVFHFYLLCPFLIVVGTVWGMFDVLVFIFAILSAYLLLKRRSLSAVSLALASSLKPYAIILAPLYSILIYKKFRSVKSASHYLLVVLVLLSLLTLFPMLLFRWPLSNLYCALSAHLSSINFYYEEGVPYTYGAASPFNIYNVLRLFFPEIEPPSFLNYIWIGGCLVSYIYIFLYTAESDFKSIINYSFLTSLLFFTTRFWVSEQNLIFLLSFFILTVFFNKRRGGWRLIHTFWILLLAFVLIHVPASGFLWIVNPRALDAATAFCNGPYGYLRWILMSVLTFSWLYIMFWYSFRERIIWLG